MSASDAEHDDDDLAIPVEDSDQEEDQVGQLKSFDGSTSSRPSCGAIRPTFFAQPCSLSNSHHVLRTSKNVTEQNEILPDSRCLWELGSLADPLFRRHGPAGDRDLLPDSHHDLHERHGRLLVSAAATFSRSPGTSVQYGEI